MKVLYDTEVLALSVVDERSRTGIFRVIKNVAAGLIASKECELYYSAAHLLEKEAYVYMQSDKLLRQRPIIYPTKLQKRVKLWHDKTLAMEKQIGRNQQIIKNKLLLDTLRITRRVLYKTRTNYLLPEKMDLKVLNRMDIFHSPYYPIPSNITNQKKIKRLLTVYDLIPVLHPQYFPEQEEHTVKKAIRTIGADGYAFTISQATKDDLCNHQKEVNPEHVFVTHLAASPQLFYPVTDPGMITRMRAKYNIPEGPYFLGLSTLEPRKNLDHAIRCLARVIQEANLPDLHLVLVGTKGWLFDKIFTELDKAGPVRKRVILTGFVDDADLAALYSGALGFIYPSFYEGFGLPPLEAMQCGVPVITSNTSSLPEVVGNAGIMLDPRDEDALCQAMLKVYQDNKLRAEMAKMSLEQAAKFSWEKCVRQTIDGYKAALAT
jgi:glycosyltransferase involved in cell wall biosynthesis